MFHQPPTNFLYSAYLLRATFSKDHDKDIHCTATGFVIEANGKGWIVTNRHAIDIDYRKQTPKYKGYNLSELTITGRRPDETTYTLKIHQEAKFYHHSEYENDLVVIEPFIENLKENDKLHWHFGLEHLPTTEIMANQIQPYDTICYTGFPDQYDKFSGRPILRSGHIASDPRYNYSYDNSYQGQLVAYEGFSSSGASGSPVFTPPRGAHGMPNSRDGYLVGINSGHLTNKDTNPETHSGISYFYKSTLIKEILISNGLINS